MLGLMMYAICLCLFFKGVQIFIISVPPTLTWQRRVRVIGLASLVITFVAAAWLAYAFTAKGWQLEQGLRQMLAPAPSYRPQNF